MLRRLAALTLAAGALALAAAPAEATNASSDAAVTAANPYISDVGAPEDVTDFLPEPNLTVRDNLLAFWHMRLYETVPYPKYRWLRAARWMESRYWLWGQNRGADIVARRYFRQRVTTVRGKRVVVMPPRRGTIGPVRYFYPYGWSPGFGQRSPCWWDENLGDNKPARCSR